MLYQYNFDIERLKGIGRSRGKNRKDRRDKEEIEKEKQRGMRRAREIEETVGYKVHRVYY